MALTIGLRVLQNRVGAVPRPSWCTYLVCNRCNARCQMCDSWRIPRGYELTVAEVREVFGKIGALDLVRLSGGEPFLRADFEELAAAVMEVSRPAILHITTNGSFPERIVRFARAFARPRRLRFMVSLDGLADEHDANRGKQVTFDRAVETIRRLIAERHRGLDVTVNHTVISNRSMRDADELRARLTALGTDVQTVLAYEDSAMYGETRRGTIADDLAAGDFPLHPALDRAAAMRFVEAELARVAAIRNPALRVGKRYYLRGLHARLAGEGTEAPAPNPKCVAVRSHIRLLPDGRVPVCQFNTRVIGDLRVQSFDEVWRGATAADARTWVDACKGCWAECEVIPNAIYSGDILRPSHAHTPKTGRR